MNTLTTVLTWVLGSTCLCSLLMLVLGTVAVYGMRAKTSASDPTEPEQIPPPPSLIEQSMQHEDGTDAAFYRNAHELWSTPWAVPQQHNGGPN